MRRPLYELQRQVEKIDLDPIQDPLEGEDAPAEIIDNAILDFVINSLNLHFITLHEHRVGFKEKIEDIGKVTRDNMIFPTKEEFITFGENCIRELLNDREL